MHSNTADWGTSGSLPWRRFVSSLFNITLQIHLLLERVACWLQAATILRYHRRVLGDGDTLEVIPLIAIFTANREKWVVNLLLAGMTIPNYSFLALKEWSSWFIWDMLSYCVSGVGVWAVHAEAKPMPLQTASLPRKVKSCLRTVVNMGIWVHDHRDVERSGYVSMLHKLYWGRKKGFQWVAWNWVINLRSPACSRWKKRKLTTQFHATTGK